MRRDNDRDDLTADGDHGGAERGPAEPLRYRGSLASDTGYCDGSLQRGEDQQGYIQLNSPGLQYNPGGIPARGERIAGGNDSGGRSEPGGGIRECPGDVHDGQDEHRQPIDRLRAETHWGGGDAMTPAEVLALIQLFAVIEPVAVQGIQSAIAMFESSTLTTDQKMKMLTDLAAALKPMTLVP